MGVDLPSCRDGSLLPLPLLRGRVGVGALAANTNDGVRRDAPSPGATRRPPPPELGDSRILFLGCKKITFEYCSEMVPTVSHGLGSRRFIVAIPAAETCRNPGDEGE